MISYYRVYDLFLYDGKWIIIGNCLEFGVRVIYLVPIFYTEGHIVFPNRQIIHAINFTKRVRYITMMP